MIPGVVHPSRLFTSVVSAPRVTVIPIDNAALIAIDRGETGRPVCTFPGGIKVHQRVRAETAAHWLLQRGLGCTYTDLRLVAVLDAEPGHQREVVFTASVRWPGHRPAYDGSRLHRLVSVAARQEATRAGLGPARVVDLLTGDDLLAAAVALPQLVSLDEQPDTSTDTSRRDG